MHQLIYSLSKKMVINLRVLGHYHNNECHLSCNIGTIHYQPLTTTWPSFIGLCLAIIEL